jgi:hypothetical protein
LIFQIIQAETARERPQLKVGEKLDRRDRGRNGAEVAEKTAAAGCPTLRGFRRVDLEVLRLFADPAKFPAQRRSELRNRRAMTDPVVLDLNSIFFYEWSHSVWTTREIA